VLLLAETATKIFTCIFCTYIFRIKHFLKLFLFELYVYRLSCMYTVVTKAVKRPYLGNYSDGRDTKMTAIPNFVFMFYTYEGFKFNILMLLTKNHIFVGHLGFHATEKNAQHLQSSIRRIWTQHTLVDRKQQKSIIYVEKQGCVTSSPDYVENLSCSTSWTLFVTPERI